MTDTTFARLLDVERAARDLLNITGRGSSNDHEDLDDARYNLREALFHLDEARHEIKVESARLSEVLRTGT